MATSLENADRSLQRVQEFDLETLPRDAELGSALNFKEAVEPASRIINLFRQFPRQFLSDLPDSQLSQIVQSADGFYNVLTDILKFDPKEPNSYERRTGLIQNLKNQYQTLFNQLHELISYGASRQRDFATLEQDFRASIQRSEDSAAEMMKKLQDQQQEGQRIIDEVRKVAAEQGVSQEAHYFRDESGAHRTESDNWRWWTIATAAVLGVYAIISLFLHKIDFLTPHTTYDAVQLSLSKLLIFAVLAYLLLLCARNFLAHKHNEIVNKHRQNALLTFQALVEAAGSAERRDVILTYAAACIFSPQETGYTRVSDATKTEMPMNIIQAIPKLLPDK